MKKYLFTLFAVLFSIVSLADSVEINGIYYDFIEKAKTAEVVSNPNKYSGDIVIPDSIEYDGKFYIVKHIGEKAFYECKGLMSIKLPETITEIKDQAFCYCEAIENFTIPNSVEQIGASAFAFCIRLESIIIPNKVQTIPWGTFQYCDNLSYVSMGDNVKQFGRYAFSNCKNLKSIKISNQLQLIDVSAFEKCKSLKVIDIPETVTDINSAFYECTSLERVNITNLKAFCKIYYHYDNSTPLNNAHHLYLNGEEIVDLVIPDGISAIGMLSFCGGSGFKTITIPNSVISIGNSAFSGCSGIDSLLIPNSVSSIGDYAFSGCSKLSNLILGNNVSYVGNCSFANCKEISRVFCYPLAVPSIENNAFKDSYVEHATLYVPESVIGDYKSNPVWSSFGEILTLSDQEIKKCENPTIKYNKGKIEFECDTENARFISTISNSDVNAYYSDVIELSATYIITVYAASEGYENSDVVTATLCWIDTEPIMEGFSNGIANIKAQPVLIQNYDGIITIDGIEDGTRVSAYTLNGIQVSSIISRNGGAILNTNAKSGSTVIVKIGNKSVKVLLK